MDTHIYSKFAADNAEYRCNGDVLHYFIGKLGHKVNSFWGIMPIGVEELEFACFKPSGYLCAMKKNGLRALMYCHDGYVTFQFRDNTKLTYEWMYRGYSAIFDVEILEDQIVLLDCLYSDEPDGDVFEMRFGDVHLFAAKNAKYRGYKIVTQKYRAMSYITDMQEFNDEEGIIIIDREATVDGKRNGIYKWKKPELCTIDILVKNKKAYTSDDKELMSIDLDDGIWEIKLDGTVIGKRIKDKPNHSVTVISALYNYNTSFEDLKAMLSTSSYVQKCFTLDDVITSLKSEEIVEIVKEDEVPCFITPNLPIVTEKKKKKKKKAKKNSAAIEKYETVAFVEDRMLTPICKRAPEIEWTKMRKEIINRMHLNDNIKKAILETSVITDNECIIMSRLGEKIVIPGNTVDEVYNFFLSIIEMQIRDYKFYAESVAISLLGHNCEVKYDMFKLVLKMLTFNSGKFFIKKSRYIIVNKAGYIKQISFRDNQRKWKFKIII